MLRNKLRSLLLWLSPCAFLFRKARSETASDVSARHHRSFLGHQTSLSPPLVCSWGLSLLPSVQVCHANGSGRSLPPINLFTLHISLSSLLLSHLFTLFSIHPDLYDGPWTVPPPVTHLLLCCSISKSVTSFSVILTYRSDLLARFQLIQRWATLLTGVKMRYRACLGVVTGFACLTSAAVLPR